MSLDIIVFKRAWNMNILSVRREISKYYKGVKKKHAGWRYGEKEMLKCPAGGSISGNNYHGEKPGNIYGMCVYIHDTYAHIYITYINACIICIHRYIYIHIYALF